MSVFGARLRRARAGAGPATPLPAGWWFGLSPVAGTTSALAANTMYGVPWIAPETCRVDQIALRVTTGAVGNCKMALYDALAATRLPGAKLAEISADLDTSGSNVNLVGTFAAPPVVVAGRLYWMAAVCSGTPTVFAFGHALPLAAGFMYPLGGPDVGAVLANHNSLNSNRHTVALTYSAGGAFMPASFGTGAFGTGLPSSPIMGLRRA